MFSKICSILHIRRRRSDLLRVPIIIFFIYLFVQIKNHFTIYSLNENIITNISIYQNVSFKKTQLNCFGDPLKKWCENEVKLCDPYLIVYNHLFVVTHSAILQPEFAKGKRIGGENLQDVLNQAEQDEFFQFEKEFIKLPCDIPSLDGKLPNNHLSRIVSSATSYKTQPTVQIINETTIAVRRQDYVNFYHTITDVYTVYVLCRFVRQDPKSVRILFLDAHPKGNLDILWSQLFHSYTRLGQLKTVSTILYKELIFSQPQPDSEIDIQQKRRQAPSFFFDFREHILKQFNTSYQINSKLNCQSLNIFFLVRHNYVAHPRNPSGKITRQLLNEKEILSYLKMKFSNYPSINFSSNHFEELSIEEQLNIIVQTDVFIGMHGAGLTHVLFLKSNRAFVELGFGYHAATHFDFLASINNINYQHCAIVNGDSTTAQTIFNCITKTLGKICPSLITSTVATQIVNSTSAFIGNISSNNTKS